MYVNDEDIIIINGIWEWQKGCVANIAIYKYRVFILALMFYDILTAS